MAELRIVSLIASATEIVAALGCGEALVGRSHECDYPPHVLSLPPCSAPRIDVHGSSRQIDDRVKDVLRDGVSVYLVDAALLDRLQPTHVITQTQCDVCAVTLADVERAVREAASSRPELISLAPLGLADVWTDMQRVADALGVAERGRELVAALQARLATLAARASGAADHPSIGCIEWIDPLMCAGNWVPELVTLAGGRDMLGKPRVHSPYLSWRDLASADPDVIMVMPCGYDIAKTREEMPALTRQPGWSSLRAVRMGRVYLADGNQYFNRPGPRLVESAEILAEVLHPQLFRFGHARKGWVRFEG